MNRRRFLRSLGVMSAGAALVSRAGGWAAEAASLPAQEASANGWRTFEVTTRVEMLKPVGRTRIWLPAALTRETPFQRTMGNTFQANGGTARLIKSSPVDG